MMKKVFILLMVLAIGAEFYGSAEAALIPTGTGTSVHGTYNLIYDTDLNITWYDYTAGADTWQNQVGWVEALTVESGGTGYGDWRLPRTVDGQFVWGYDGSTTAGYSITTSEMGHLYYTELGNLGYKDISGNIQPGWGLNNTDPFKNLMPVACWSGTEHSADEAWVFYFYYGYQTVRDKNSPYGRYALAVHDGLVGVVPEPSTLLLLGTGLTGLAGLMRRKVRD